LFVFCLFVDVFVFCFSWFVWFFQLGDFNLIKLSWRLWIRCDNGQVYIHTYRYGRKGSLQCVTT